ncbi:membrane or secreted protein, partial [Candidatus Magnetobacterium bavaricum]
MVRRVNNTWRIIVVVLVVVLYAGNALYGAAKDDSDVQNFSLGAESYRKGDYTKAVESYTRSLVSNDPKVEMRAN